MIEPTDEMVTELTPVELETLRLIADGLTDDQIAAGLFMSIGAVKSRGLRIRSKLDAATRAHAVAIAYQRGILLADTENSDLHALHVLATTLRQAGFRLISQERSEAPGPTKALKDGYEAWQHDGQGNCPHGYLTRPHEADEHHYDVPCGDRPYCRIPEHHEAGVLPP